MLTWEMVAPDLYRGSSTELDEKTFAMLIPMDDAYWPQPYFFDTDGEAIFGDFTFTPAMSLEDAKTFCENVHAEALEWVAMHPEWAKARERMDAAEWKTRQLRGPFRELGRLAVKDAGTSLELLEDA